MGAVKSSMVVRPKFFVAALLLLAAGAGCRSRTPAAERPASPEVLAKKGQGDRSANLAGVKGILVAPDRVELYRLDPSFKPFNGRLERPRSPIGEKIDGFPALRKRALSDRTLHSEVARVLLDDETYDRSGCFAACFEPGVAYRFHRAERSVAAVICFNCRNLHVIESTPDVKRRSLVGEPRLSPTGFDRLLALTKRAVPDDPDIQKIGTKDKVP